MRTTFDLDFDLDHINNARNEFLRSRKDGIAHQSSFIMKKDHINNVRNEFLRS